MKYNLAIVGCGAISAKHLQACADSIDRCNLVALCDIDIERAKKVSESYAAAAPAVALAAFDDYGEMLDTAKPDIVSIATSSSSHYGIARAALMADAHVILEKPIALSTKEAREIVELAEKRKKKLAVCFVTRFAPHVLALRSAVTNGQLGKIFHAAVQLRWNRGDDYFLAAPWRGTWKDDGGMLMNQGTHGIDLLLWLLSGEVESVYAVGRRFQRPVETEDFACGVVQMRSGSVAIIEATINTYPKNLTQTLSIFGETGTVVLDGTHLGEVAVWREPNSDTQEKPAEKPALTGHSALYKDFLDAVDEDREPMVNGREGLRSLEVILAAYKSMKSKCAVNMPIDFATVEMEGSWNS